MTRRILAALLGSLLLAASTAPAASAKGKVISATWTTRITGPGLAEPATFRLRAECGREAPCWFDIAPGPPLDGYTILAGSGLAGGDRPTSSRPTGSLGPRYRVVTIVRTPDRAFTVRQDLYLSGPGTSTVVPTQPWVYTPPGQRLLDGTVTSGWVAGPPSILYVLEDHGLRRSPPPASTSSASRRPVVPLLAGLLVLVMLVALVLRRARAARSPHAVGAQGRTG